ncbi:MAG: hemerythrin domain-containing protein [Mesorhizobium sp.]|uniref:hemerythrin domain-containing protein n=1 Tax=Mesorhizobium sp. TaxID=1871066 RepID=UPI000FE55FC1|nr:hemerythrin domain-containing protein [Mesorhizobium sp.]RWC41615.1 MAG: hemerythrin domain-containing protein [Mesorhizobium sp.]RWE88455.1 MAG: hemerythrin domain-containing protein [Mesorhizobium sp.]RWE94255.1 MAG: hemerythrin domain-containing protein [Mesorhizobium sp.]TIW47756.1 MAG: hemerythrin domain-containing protein [Mesorhizobium sp.]TIX58814.1 MAG: hemerythrin domain-containing protein [Mesorhizobium sp.]
MSDATDSLLLERSGLPDDLRWLAEKYPREIWQAHSNIHGIATMWLQRHDMFRELGGMLTNGIGDYHEGRLTGPEFARWFAPRLNHFLSNLDGHHNVEDHHYFPVFAKAEVRLKRGFEILDADHHTIHEGLERNAETANAFIRTLQDSEDKQRFAADAYADENSRLIAMLTRHLADEEDLIIPLILDRGDRALGID